jgi:ERCC4-type nuclease
MKATVLVDTREKVNQHILTKLNQLNIPYRLKKLNYGDYSFEWNGTSYEDKIVIERKASFDELIRNFTKGRERFKREFERAKGCKVILLVESSIEQLEGHQYRSGMSPKDLKSFLNTWCYKYQLELHFLDKSKSCNFMLEQFREFVKKQKL